MSGAKGATGRAIVIGGSMSGLFTCLALQRIGWEAHIFERVETGLAGRGAGIATHRELFEVLEGVGMETGTDLGIAVRGRRTLDRDGSIVGERPIKQTMTSWDRIYSLVRELVPEGNYHNGKSLEAIAEGNGKVTARFADGTSAWGDLLIGADGFRSAVRAQLFPDIVPIYAGYVAWRGLIKEVELSPPAHRALGEYLAFCLPPGEQILGYPVAGPDNDLRPGHRRYNFVWYRPVDEAIELRRMLTDDGGIFHPVSISPKLIRGDAVDDMRAAADAVLAPQFAEVVRRTAEPFFQPIYDLETPRMVSGRCVILGDAAFVARPHVGAGVTKAAGDARALAEALVERNHDVETALHAFEGARLEVGQAIVARARHLGAYMQAQLKTPEEQALAERHRTPEAVMEETATLDFLRVRL